MNKLSRKLNSYQKGMKKIRCQDKIISINSIENLSNEILYEIFDYLDGCLIYQGFFNLNFRFQQLLHSSSLLFKIKFDSKSDQLYENFFQQLTLMNKHQIYSLNLHLSLPNNHFFASFLIDSSLDHLRSLTLHQLELDVLISVLSNLSSLTQLSALTIDIFDVLKHATDIYRMVFSLKTLTYFNFSANNSSLFISLPIPTDQQYSPIKYLVTNHCCTFSELSTLVSYTPELRYLDYINININHLDIGMILPITLSNLTTIFLCMCEIKYEEFEMFINGFKAKLKSFSFTTLSEDILYLDAVRWQEIIIKHFPVLKEFCFLYHEYIDYEYQSPIDPGEANQFATSFWIEHHWIFEAKTERQCIVYSVYTYEKRWYEYNTQLNTITSEQFLKSTRLILTEIPPLECQELITIYINRALIFAQYYHLEILDDQIFIGALIQAVDLLPELISLKISSLSLEEPRDLCEEEVDILLSREDSSKITRVYLEEMMDITEIYFLMVLCPSMEYLKVGWINNIEIELFVRKMLKKINFEHNQYLRLLCIRVPAADDEMVNKLENMINSEKLLIDYTIKRVRINIYLQWK